VVLHISSAQALMSSVEQIRLASIRCEGYLFLAFLFLVRRRLKDKKQAAFLSALKLRDIDDRRHHELNHIIFIVPKRTDEQ
jgi:hypothetical protein